MHPSTLPTPPLRPPPVPVRPAFPKRARTSRAQGAESWTFDTRRGYSHYNQTSTPLPVLPPPHTHASQGHAALAPALWRGPLIPAIGALPAIAAGVKSIHKWHMRGLELGPQSTALRRAQSTLDAYLAQTAGSQALTGMHPATRAWLETHRQAWALHADAISRAIDEGATKTAAACCELFTFMLMPLPTLHSLLGVEAGSMLMRPYTTLIIPAAFLLTAAVQAIRNGERFNEAFGLWAAARGAAIGATGVRPQDVQLPAMGDAALPRALLRECVYAAAQVFFWGAFACGMSAASGSMFAGLIAPSVAVVCLLVGVIGTTATHMGWANAYCAPDRIDEASPDDFGPLSERRLSYEYLAEEAGHIETLRLNCSTHLPASQAFLFQSVIAMLEAVPQTSTAVDWLLGRWFAPVAQAMGPAITAHLTRMCHSRIAHQQRVVTALHAQIGGQHERRVRQDIEAMPQDIAAIAAQALARHDAQLEQVHADLTQHLSLLTRLENADALSDWQALCAAWLVCEGDAQSVSVDLTKGLYHALISQPLGAIRREQAYLKWVQRVALNS